MVDRNRIIQILDELGLTELNHIKQIREDLGLTVEELADTCNISATEMTYIENHQRIPSQVVIIRVLRGFNKLGIHPHKVFTFF